MATWDQFALPPTIHHPEHFRQSPVPLCPHKINILGISMLFSYSSSSSIPLSFFFSHQYFPHLSSKKGRDTTPLIPWGPSQLPLLSHIFSYTPMGPTFHMGIGGDILGYCCSNFLNKSRKWYWATLIPSYWGSCIGGLLRCLFLLLLLLKNLTGWLKVFLFLCLPTTASLSHKVRKLVVARTICVIPIIASTPLIEQT